MYILYDVRYLTSHKTPPMLSNYPIFTPNKAHIKHCSLETPEHYPHKQKYKSATPYRIMLCNTEATRATLLLRKKGRKKTSVIP